MIFVKKQNLNKERKSWKCYLSITFSISFPINYKNATFHLLDVYYVPGTMANLLGNLLLLLLYIPVKSVFFTIVISQVKTQKLGEVEQFASGHTICTLRNPDLTQICLSLKFKLSIISALLPPGLSPWIKSELLSPLISFYDEVLTLWLHIAPQTAALEMSYYHN